MGTQRKTALLILISLYILAVGLFTSISLMTGFHLLMIPAILLSAKDYDWKKFPRSGWALLAFAMALVLSVVVNRNIILRPSKNIFKTKYFLIGALSLIPLQFYFQQYLTVEKRRKVLGTLFFVLLTSACVATLSGLIGYFTGFNPLRMVHVSSNRNGGLFGMLITYAHSIAWLSVFLVGIGCHYEHFKSLISKKWLYFFTAVSLVGLFATHTRGAWISFLVGCSLINKKLTGVMCLLTVLGVIGLSLHNPHFWEEEIVRRGSNSERWGSALAAVKAFQEKPLFGYGYLNFEPNSPEIKARYQLPEPDFGGHAHNELLEIFATSGIFGAVCFVVWLILWIREIRNKNSSTAKLVLPFIGAFLASGLTHVSLNDGENAFFLMIFYALSEVL